MKTLILYATSRGCTEKAAMHLKEHLEGVVTVNLKKDMVPDLSDYDNIIIGGSIHVGQMQKPVKKFCRDNMFQLLTKKLGLFICCMQEGDNARQQFDAAYPAELREHAAAEGLFGGEFIFAEMNFFQKAIVKKVSGHSEDVSTLDKEAVAAFAEAFK